MRKVTQAQNPYWFTLWMWSRFIEARSVRLQDLDFDRKQLKVVRKRKERPMFTFNSFNPSITKYIKAENAKITFGQPLANGTGGFDNRYS
jgi:hypothetical protein